ncbi:SIR2 family protein [Acinetobacter pittii]|uniref:SIR2 family protein n=1 Tax=Acinetobacter pittii TaxID=48296 RepID=UPI002952A1B3|nr:SIR2 family protein [Acinetobacter pittii]MDV8152431.1 SIR2 family protein [Acinetobacter pittii]
MNKDYFKDNTLLFILGAGSSIDAGIPTAYKMVSDFEDRIKNDNELKKLYSYFKSAIIFQRGLKCYSPNVSVSIEEILNVIEALNLQEDNILYPYIGTWSQHFLKTSGADFENVRKLDVKIRELLFSWVTLNDYRKSKYFSNIGRLATDINTSIRIFSLNYDICVEKAFRISDMRIETGISPETYEWSSLRFDDLPDNEIPDAYLYKLHGSIDWEKQDSGLPKYSETPIKDDPQVIFGTAVKLRSLDPYLFNLYELRKYSLHENLRFIVIIGYSFSDDHINRLIQQSLLQRKLIKLIIIAPDNEEKLYERTVREKFLTESIEDNRLIFVNEFAKNFLENLNLDFFNQYYQEDPDLPF